MVVQQLVVILMFSWDETSSSYSTTFSEIEGLLLIWMLAAAFLSVCWPWSLDMECAGVTASVPPGWQAALRTCLQVSKGQLWPTHCWTSSGSALCLPMGLLVVVAHAYLWSHDSSCKQWHVSWERYKKWSSHIPPLFTCPTIITPCLSSRLRFLLSSLLSCHNTASSVCLHTVNPQSSLWVWLEGWHFSMQLYWYQCVGIAVQQCHPTLRVTLHFAFCKLLDVLSF